MIQSGLVWNICAHGSVKMRRGNETMRREKTNSVAVSAGNVTTVIQLMHIVSKATSGHTAE